MEAAADHSELPGDASNDAGNPGGCWFCSECGAGQRKDRARCETALATTSNKDQGGLNRRPNPYSCFGSRYKRGQHAQTRERSDGKGYKPYWISERLTVGSAGCGHLLWRSPLNVAKRHEATRADVLSWQGFAYPSPPANKRSIEQARHRTSQRKTLNTLVAVVA